MSDLPVADVTGARTAASIGLLRLSSGVPVIVSSREPLKAKAKGLTIREALATIQLRAFRSRAKSQRTNSKLLAGIADAIWSIALFCLAPLGFACLFFTTGQVLGAQGEGLVVSDAWVPAADEVGRDLPLLVAIRNEADFPDSLMRVRCPVANFFEKHTVDRGEGSPAMRPISSIPVPASSTVVLKAGAYHMMLLQIRQPLAVGEHFKCTLVFQKAGSIETEVEVR
jgi:copper(I)-binding protein